ncbi:hypothetical protein [Planctopirus limnophila]|nr:hypothetical protein [Planctopirus limnophila]
MTDLDWLATRYVLGELSADEAFAFEERLQVDLWACEAVVQATRLLTDVAVNLPEPADVREQVIVAPVAVTAKVAVSTKVDVAAKTVRSTPANRSEQRPGWWVISLMTAALVLLAVGLQFEWNPWGDQRVALENSSGTSDSGRLRGEEARLAANLLGGWRTIDVDMTETGLTMIHRETGNDRETNRDHEEAAESIDENSIPDWMIAALLADPSEGETNARPATAPHNVAPAPGQMIQ